MDSIQHEHASIPAPMAKARITPEINIRPDGAVLSYPHIHGTGRCGSLRGLMHMVRMRTVLAESRTWSHRRGDRREHIIRRRNKLTIARITISAARSTAASAASLHTGNAPEILPEIHLQRGWEEMRRPCSSSRSSGSSAQRFPSGHLRILHPLCSCT